MANGAILVDAAPVLNRLRQDIEGSHAFPSVLIGEPKALPVTAKTTVALYFKGIGVAELSLSGVVNTLDFWVRLYIPMLRLPQSQIEIDLMNGYLAIFQALAADVTLGAQARNIDFAGPSGGEMTEKAGYVNLSGTECRVADISVSVRLDQEGIFDYQDF